MIQKRQNEGTNDYKANNPEKVKECLNPKP